MSARFLHVSEGWVAEKGIAPRHRLAVEALEIEGRESVLEIGCGHGVATRLVLEALMTGQITALDRSAKMIAAVEAGSAAALKEGRLVTRAEALEDADFGGKTFDAILAVNVDLNLRLEKRWAPLLKGLLAKGGRIVLAFEPPPASRKGDAFAKVTRERLEAGGFAVTASTGEGGVCVLVARVS